MGCWQIYLSPHLMWHCRAECVNTVSCHCDMITLVVLSFPSNPNRFTIYDFLASHQLLGFIKRACLHAACPQNVDRQEELIVFSFCKHARKRSGKGDEGREPNFCCCVYEMLTSQRWVDDKRSCPVGIKIYLSQVTPTGNKQPDSSLSVSFSHKLPSLHASVPVHIPTAENTHTHTHRTILQHMHIVCQVWQAL